MKDSFIEKGNGYGTTYNFKFLPFRIDFVLADKDIEITDHKNYDIEVSDHYPIMATFTLN
jgi:endonuclease/exonuclease/phosphatase family metal-dependent hydrolase